MEITTKDRIRLDEILTIFIGGSRQEKRAVFVIGEYQIFEDRKSKVFNIEYKVSYRHKLSMVTQRRSKVLIKIDEDFLINKSDSEVLILITQQLMKNLEYLGEEVSKNINIDIPDEDLWDVNNIFSIY